jgi:hypothetical protein
LRVAPLQPRLELSAQWPLIADDPTAQRPAVRALFGGAVPF